MFNYTSNIQIVSFGFPVDLYFNIKYLYIEQYG